MAQESMPAMDPEDKKLLEELGKQLEDIRAINPDTDSIYNLITIFAGIVIEYRDRKSDDDNWVARVTNMHGNSVFTKEEELEIEKFMKQYGNIILNALQLGDDRMKGGVGPAAAGAAPAAAGAAGAAAPRDKALAALSAISEFIDPRSVSLDGAVEFVLEYLDSANSKMEDLSRQIGIVKLENTVHGIPLEPIGIPYQLPMRFLVILVQGVFEIIRLIALFGFPGAGIFRVVGSLFAGLLELFKGDWKSALFTFMGMAGNGMMTMGLFGKIMVKVMSFMAPSMRDKLVLTGVQSMKSWILGIALFGFQTFAPLQIKQMVDTNLGKLSEMLNDVQEEVDEVMQPLVASEEFKCFEVTWLNLTDASKFPDYDSLIKLQDLFMQPAFYCNSSVRKFVDEIKFVPPARIILELLGLPTTDKGYAEVCWNLPSSIIEGGLDRAILQTLKPVIRPKKPSEGCPGYQEAALRDAAEVARKKLENVFSLGEDADPIMASFAGSIRTGTEEAVGLAANATSAAGKKAKESAQSMIGEIKAFKPPQLGLDQLQGKLPTMAMMPGQGQGQGQGQQLQQQQQGQQAQTASQLQTQNPFARAGQSMLQGVVGSVLPKQASLQVKF